MITDALVGVLSSILDWINSLVPNLTLPSFLTAIGTKQDGKWNDSIFVLFGSLLHPLHDVIPGPFDTLFDVMKDFLSLWPLVAGYLLFDWILNRMPTIAGFKP